MSLLTLIKAQFGKSNTPANNFTLDASAGNGTMKLARGNAGATTQDILTVDASGNVLVDGNNLNLFSAKSLTASGYQKLPSGLIIQWGRAPLSSGSASVAGTFPIAFPSVCLSLTITPDSLSGTNGVFASTDPGLLSRTGYGYSLWIASSTRQASVGAYFVAIGY